MVLPVLSATEATILHLERVNNVTTGRTATRQVKRKGDARTVFSLVSFLKKKKYL